MWISPQWSLKKPKMFPLVAFPGVMYGCESWTIKKAEHRRSDAFELWCWRRLFESPLDYKEIKPVSPKGNQSWSWNFHVLGTWWEKLIHWKRPWCWERLKAGGEEDDRGWDGCMASLTWWTWVWANSGRWWRTGKPGVLLSTGLQRFGHNLATEQQLCNELHGKRI